MAQMRIVQVEGSEYIPAQDVAEAAGISRQTLWRWRQDGKVPAGHRLRDKLLVFTTEELDQICQYANRIEPIADDARSQLGLFAKATRR